MDAGVLSHPPQFLFSIPDGPDGSAPLTYGSNGQFQMTPGGSVEGDGASHGDTDSSGEGASLSNESSGLHDSEAVPKQQATASSNLPESLPSSFKATPSPSTRVPKSVVTTATGSVNKLFSNQVPTSSPQSSLPLFGISSETRGSSTLTLYSLSPKSFSLVSLSRSKSVSPTVPLSSTSSCAAGYLGYPCSSPVNSDSATSTPQLVTIAPAIPAKFSSSGVQSSSWYLAVIFGTIAGVAFLIFLISVIVVVRRTAKRRRMARDIEVPWARPGDEEDGRLFFGSLRTASHSANAAMNPHSVHGQLRPSGRELGVPSGLSNEPGYSLHDHPIPGSRLFSDEPPPPRSEELTLGHHPHPTNALRLLPSHLIDEELAARANQQDGPYPAFPCKAGRLRKRSWGHLDDATDVNPYINPPIESVKNELNTTTPAAPTRRHLVDRLRNLGNQDRERSLSWDRLPTPGKDQTRDDREPWASSFKASLVNAFNALGLRAQNSSGEYGSDSDRLTQVPTRHRPSIRRSCMQPHRASTKSTGWILHEKEDGTGTVQFLPSLDKHYGRSTPAPGRLVPVLSFGQPGVSADEKGDFQRKERLIYPRTPFLPATAVIHPHRNKHPFLTKRNPISRDSSCYSTSSLTTPKCDPSAASPGRRLAGIPALDQNDVVVIEPDFFSSRGSSPISR